MFKREGCADTILLPERAYPAEAVRSAAAVRAALPALLRGALVSTLVLVPCFWQGRIQAGDLASHAYNAWLSQLIVHGKAEGLYLAPQWTNVLFDLMLRGLVRLFDFALAQQVAVSVTVLVFFWGAFCLACAVTRRRPWFMMPCLAMLAYGWVFHMGFFNFYLSTGLCLFALAVLWKPAARPLAVPLLLAAAVAHALPVGWAVAVAGYAWAARKLAPRKRVVLALIALVLMVLGRIVLEMRYECFWTARQLQNSFGADQVWVFGAKYFVCTLAVLVFWLLLFAQVTTRKCAERVVLGVPFQVCILTITGLILIPRAIVLPMYNAAFEFISERLSLEAGILVCCFLGTARPRRFEVALIGGAAALFFSFLYADTRALNRIEERIGQEIAALPQGQRVVSSLCQTRSRINAVLHIIDRACIGSCLSYGNYEASTAQFSVRARPENTVVMAERAAVSDLEWGKYIVRETDVPLYLLRVDGGDKPQFSVRALKPGEVTGSTCFQATPPLWSGGD